MCTVGIVTILFCEGFGSSSDIPRFNKVSDGFEFRECGIAALIRFHLVVYQHYLVVAIEAFAELMVFMQIDTSAAIRTGETDELHWQKIVYGI